MKYWNLTRKAMLLFTLLTLPIFVAIAIIFETFILGFVYQQIDWNSIGNSLLKIMKTNILLLTIMTLINLLIYLLLMTLVIHFYKNKTKFIRRAKTNEHGGAKWIIDEEKLKENNSKKFNQIYPLATSISKSGWVIRTKNIKDKNIFNIRSETQALCLGATGSGKTQKIIIPGAIYNSRLSDNNKPCMVFTDPKGELCEKLSEPLKKQGYEILILNIREPKFSSGWNPLIMAYKYYYDAVTFYDNNINQITKNNIQEFTKLTNEIKCFIHSKLSCTECLKQIKVENKQGQIYLFKKQYWIYSQTYLNKLVQSSILELKAAAYEEVEDLISTLFPIPKTDNPMWTQNAGRMTAGVIYALLEILDINPSDLPLAKFNLTTVSVLLANQTNLINWFKLLGNINPTSKAFITAAPVVNSAEATRQGAFSNIGPALKIFEDLGIQNITCNNDIDLFDFTSKPKALFLIIPDEKTNRHIIGSLFISQLYKANVFVANNSGGKLTRSVQFYLDEFGNMPTIPHFSTFITVARSRNMFFLLVLQDFKQLYEKYGQQNGMTIRSNCNLNIYIQTNDHDTADAYSKMIGDHTVISSSVTNIKIKKDKNNGSSSQTGLPLIKGSDLMRLKDPYGVVIYAKENPAKIYMEYAYNCSDFNLGSYNPINKQKVNVIDFYKDHFFNLLGYDLQSKLKEKYANEFQEFIEQEEETQTFSETYQELQEQESHIRDQIYQLELCDYEKLTTEEKLNLTNLRERIRLIKNKLNNFINQAE